MRQPASDRGRLDEYHVRMPLTRCEFCIARPVREVAVSRWVTDPDDRERVTIQLCRKHLQRVNKAGTRGHEHRGMHYKLGFW